MSEAVCGHRKFYRHEGLMLPVVDRPVEFESVVLVQHTLPDFIAYETPDVVVPDYVLIEPADLLLGFVESLTIEGEGVSCCLGRP